MDLENLKALTLGDAFMRLGLRWFEDKYPEGLVLNSRNSVFNDALAMWLIIAQKGIASNSLVSAVQQLKQTTSLDAVAKLLSGSRKFALRAISSNPGGFSHARHRLPLEKVEQFADDLSATVEQEHRGTSTVYGYHGFVMDGSFVHLSNTEEIRQVFPPLSNQHRTLQPQARIVVAHNLVTGAAVRPEIGSSYDSEQALCLPLMRRLPKKSLVVGDRNFGVFSVVWGAQQEGLKSLIRMQSARAKSLLGKASIDSDGEYPVTWSPSARERKTHPDLPAEASATGRLIAITLSVPGKRAERYFFFTTANDLTPEQVLETYKKRWFIETDLRSIKQTVSLDRVSGQSSDIVKKEIILAVAAYTLIRTVVATGARMLELEPRELSFSRARDTVITTSILISKARTVKELQLTLQQFLPSLRQCKHPKRKNFRSEPRAIVATGKRTFPPLKISRLEARQKLINSRS